MFRSALACHLSLCLFLLTAMAQARPLALEKPEYTDAESEQVIRDYFAAIGGYRHYLSIRSLLTFAEVSQPGQKVAISAAREYPYYARVESAAAEQPEQPTRIEGSNGSQIWVYTPDSATAKMHTEPWRYTPAYDFRGPFVDYERKGIVYASLGMGTFRDRPVRILRAWYPDGTIERLHFSTENHLLLGSVSEKGAQPNMPQLTNVVARYQDYAGILFPTEVHTYAGDQIIQALVIHDIQVNHEFSPSLFDPPSSTHK